METLFIKYSEVGEPILEVLKNAIKDFCYREDFYLRVDYNCCVKENEELRSIMKIEILTELTI